jgi:hypothetical protein
MPKVRQIGSTPKRAWWASMNLTAPAGSSRAPARKGARRLHDLVRAAQLTVLVFKLLHALALC